MCCWGNAFSLCPSGGKNTSKLRAETILILFLIPVAITSSCGYISESPVRYLCTTLLLIETCSVAKKGEPLLYRGQLLFVRCYHDNRSRKYQLCYLKLHSQKEPRASKVYFIIEVLMLLFQRLGALFEIAVSAEISYRCR